MSLDKEIKDYLKVAQTAARSSGDFLMEFSVSARKINKETDKDVKIQADVESEKIIINYLKKHSDFSILSEETGLIERENKEFRWVIDPLDGTFNYTRAMPLCCVSIGLWQGESPILGSIYNFNNDELISGIASGGAWLNSKPVKVSSVSQKDKACLCTGFPVNTDFTSQGMHRFIEDSLSYKKIRMLGSAALSIASVACARADAYRERDIMFWDVAGGIPVLLGAGGKFTMEKAKKPDSFNIFVWNGCFNV